MDSPRLARLLVSLCHRGVRREVLLGDLEEGFAVRRERWGDVRRARRWYWGQALRAVGALCARPFYRVAGAHLKDHGAARRARSEADWGRGREGVMGRLTSDVRYAIRSYAKRPGFTALVVVTLALGIGANTAIFSVVDGVLLRPLPFEEPDRLTFVWGRLAETSVDRAPLSGPDLLDMRERSESFEAIAGVFATRSTLTGEFEPQPIQLGWGTTNLFDVLGVRPALGRGFEPSDRVDMAPGAFNDPDITPPPAAAIISHGIWQRQFGGAEDVVGSTVRVNGQSLHIVGVTPPGFRLYLPANASMPTDIDVWMPVPVALSEGSRDGQWLTLIGRLAGGVPLERARAEMRAIAAQLREEHQFHSNVGTEIEVVPLHADVVEHIRPVLMALLGAVGFVLLIACANVANLMLVRAQSRDREIAVRLAMGSGRRRIMSQMLTESGLLALAGGMLGLVLAVGGVDLLLALRPADLPRADAVSVDGRVFLFALAVSSLAAILFGMAPALQASRSEAITALRVRGRSDTQRTARLRDALVITEVALSLILLIGGGLMLRSFGSLQRVEPGFETERVLTANVTPPFFKYRTPESRTRFLLQIRDRLAALPGVEQAGGITPLPLTGGSQLWFGPYALTEDPDEWSRHEVDYRIALPGFFESVGTRVLRGRALTEADNEPDARPVVVIDEKMARAEWPDSDPVGKRILVMKPGADGSSFERYWADIAGVVEHIRYDDLMRDARETIYFPVKDWAFADMYFTLRTSTDPASLAGAVRDAVAEIDPEVAASRVRPFADYLDEAMAPTRFALVLIGVFATVALVLACVGLYGVLSYTVRRRTFEIGIRVALGAERGQLRRWVLGQGLVRIGIGIALGIGGALFLTRALSQILFGVSPSDPLTYAGISLLLGVVALVACYAPARRATKVDPIVALRAE